MAEVFDVRSLQHPVVQAPMAGGPSTPQLAAAVANAGGLGSVAGGYRTAEQLDADLMAARAGTSQPLCVNLFVPQPSTADPQQLAAYRQELEPEAERYDADLPAPAWNDDGWPGKVELLLDRPVEVVSFTFGLPDRAVVDRLHAAGSTVMCTVTSPHEAQVALALGADLLCIQGPEAGGHRGTFDPLAAPDRTPLLTLVTHIRSLTDRPLVASGGLMTGADVAAARAAGGDAVQCGTAFLRCPESGTRPAHRAALTARTDGITRVTRAFSGRYARGLLNRFMREHDSHAPAGYPEINTMTGPIRRAAADRGDADALNLWAGTGFGHARDLPAAQVVELLSP